MKKHVILTTLSALLLGCSTYHSLPLPEKTHYSQAPTTLTMQNVAILAVTNNPTVITTRDSLKISKAQAFAAGLLPDPQIPLNYAIPYSGPDDSIGYGAGISSDVLPFLTIKTQHQAALSAERQAKLNVLWQEWQAIAQARTLFVQCSTAEQTLHILNHYRANAALAYEHVHQSLKDGNNTVDNTTTQWLVLENLERKISTTQQQFNQCQHDLRQALGLSPRQKIKLMPPKPALLLNPKKIQKALNNVPINRPDLEALQAGYESQEYQLRQAILEQFPAINVQFLNGSDTSSVKSYGFNVTLSLPIFNRNQGNIAIANATRKSLYDTYQQRINATDNDVALIVKQYQLLTRTQQEEEKHLETMKTLLNTTTIEYQRHNLTLPDYVNIQINVIDAELNALTIQQQLLEQKIALEALLGNVS